jgi:hypothetical protein
MTSNSSTDRVTEHQCFVKAHALLTRMHYGGIKFFESQECTNLMHEFFQMDFRRDAQPHEPREQLVALIQEKIDDHREYSGCETDPCDWCRKAMSALYLPATKVEK